MLSFFTYLAVAASQTAPLPLQTEPSLEGQVIPEVGSAAALQADCIAGLGGDRPARTACTSVIAAQIDRLYPTEEDSAAPGCLVVPAISRFRVMTNVAAAIAASETVPPGDDATFAASVILRLYPCGIRRY